MLRNITLSADEALIAQARERARAEHKSLNTIFREWLQQYVGQVRRSRDLTRLMRRMKYVRPGRAFSRDDYNAR